MMNRYLAIIILLLFSFISFSQSFKGGIFAGFSACQVDGDHLSGFRRAGLVAGAYTGHDLSPKLAWQLELKFIQKGSYQSLNPEANIQHTYDLRLNYVELPVLLKYKYKRKLVFDAGPGFGYLAWHKENSENGPDYDPFNLYPFNKFEISLQIGGNYQLSKRIIINIRYLYSAVPIRRNPDGMRKILFQRGQFNNLICLSLYYQFNKPDE
jgi:hypothetical protein